MPHFALSTYSVLGLTQKSQNLKRLGVVVSHPLKIAEGGAASVFSISTKTNFKIEE